MPQFREYTIANAQQNSLSFPAQNVVIFFEDQKTSAGLEHKEESSVQHDQLQGGKTVNHVYKSVSPSLEFTRKESERRTET
jgi:hypothetical protein